MKRQALIVIFLTAASAWGGDPISDRCYDNVRLMVNSKTFRTAYPIDIPSRIDSSNKISSEPEVYRRKGDLSNTVEVLRKGIQVSQYHLTKVSCSVAMNCLKFDLFFKVNPISESQCNITEVSFRSIPDDPKNAHTIVNDRFCNFIVPRVKANREVGELPKDWINQFNFHTKLKPASNLEVRTAQICTENGSAFGAPVSATEIASPEIPRKDKAK